MPVELERAAHPHPLVEWIRLRVLGMALSLASVITFLSLFLPSWADFIFDLVMVGLIALVGKLARKR